MHTVEEHLRFLLFDRHGQYGRWNPLFDAGDGGDIGTDPVSYTHLTLPTSDLV